VPGQSASVEQPDEELLFDGPGVHAPPVQMPPVGQSVLVAQPDVELGQLQKHWQFSGGVPGEQLGQA